MCVLDQSKRKRKRLCAKSRGEAIIREGACSRGQASEGAWRSYCFGGLSKWWGGFSCAEYHTVREVVDLINFAPVSWLTCQQSVDFLKSIGHAKVLAAWFLLAWFSLQFGWEQFVVSICYCSSNCFSFTPSWGPFFFLSLRNKLVSINRGSRNGFHRCFPYFT